jgi:hypothetical protein
VVDSWDGNIEKALGSGRISRTTAVGMEATNIDMIGRYTACHRKVKLLS